MTGIINVVCQEYMRSCKALTMWAAWKQEGVNCTGQATKTLGITAG